MPGDDDDEGVTFRRVNTGDDGNDSDDGGGNGGESSRRLPSFADMRRKVVAEAKSSRDEYRRRRRERPDRPEEEYGWAFLLGMFLTYVVFAVNIGELVMPGLGWATEAPIWSSTLIVLTAALLGAFMESAFK